MIDDLVLGEHLKHRRPLLPGRRPLFPLRWRFAAIQRLPEDEFGPSRFGAVGAGAVAGGAAQWAVNDEEHQEETMPAMTPKRKGKSKSQQAYKKAHNKLLK